MKKIISALFIMCNIILGFSQEIEQDKILNKNIKIKENAPTEYYRVEITRVDRNLYKTTQGFYIKTKYCYEYATREEAVLIYEKYSRFDNKLIFKNGTSCDVEKIF